MLREDEGGTLDVSLAGLVIVAFVGGGETRFFKYGGAPELNDVSDEIG